MMFAAAWLGGGFFLRDATPGQKAMATAMAFPDAKRGMHSELKNLTGSAKVYLSQARYVLRNNPLAEGADYPPMSIVGI